MSNHTAFEPYMRLALEEASLAFDEGEVPVGAVLVRGGEVIVTRADADHEDPAIEAFLGLLEADIRAGRHVQSLPDDLAKAMLANAAHAVNLDEDIDGEVAL